MIIIQNFKFTHKTSNSKELLMMEDEVGPN